MAKQLDLFSVSARVEHYAKQPTEAEVWRRVRRPARRWRMKIIRSVVLDQPGLHGLRWPFGIPRAYIKLRHRRIVPFGMI